MIQRKITAGALATFLVLFTTLHSTAHAYIDPGTGSIILQAIVGGVFAILLGFKIFWAKIAAFFAGIFSRKKESADVDNQQR